jgi:hypothetical protein
MAYDLKLLSEKLAFNGWDARIAETKSDAAKIVMEICRDKNIVGAGHSTSVTECGIVEQLQAAGKTVVGRQVSKDRDEKLKAFTADIFILSANAVAFESGELVNIDSSCNRVAASLYGAPEVCFIIGKNKIAADLAAAIDRVRTYAAPMNNRSHGFKTPCAISGRCENCNSPERICRATVIYHKRPTTTDRGTVVLVNEDLGF